MRICRFKNNQDEARIGLTLDGFTIHDLTAAGVRDLGTLLEREDLPDYLASLKVENLPVVPQSELRFCAPVERQEVWAAGVTYLRSKTARMEESDFSATAYDRVYAAERPEIFFKSLGEKVVPTGEPVGIRRDSKWNVPEPELALVLSSKGRIVGYTLGNDMSSRDIEGENLLYLPQAKMYHRSCALGPWIRVGVAESEVRAWTIGVEIQRDGQNVFTGETSVGQIKRGFEELVGFLCRSQEFPQGAVLLTGTGVVPQDGFTLAENDFIRIHISGIGHLENRVTVV